MDRLASDLRRLPAAQQPVWADPAAVAAATAELTARPGLVQPARIDALHRELAAVAAGRALLVQAGDCAESPDERTAVDVRRKIRVLDLIAAELTAGTGLPVLRVGRIAGQYCKPRTRERELCGGQELPAYRGHLVNRPEPSVARRRADPCNLLACHDAAAEVLGHLERHTRPGPDGRTDALGVWASHEALLLDYELPQLRRDGDRVLLTSTHLPWVGERTRDPEGAHVALLAAVANPVACKVGPAMTPDQLLELCARLDPQRRPGRLTLISRMGRDLVGQRLPALVAAVREAGHPVIWSTDPMHGNTVTSPDGLKTRHIGALVEEVAGFRAAVAQGGGTAGGMHLETTPDEVTECVDDESELDRVSHKYTTLCDPRLRPEQAVAVARAWHRGS